MKDFILINIKNIMEEQYFLMEIIMKDNIRMAKDMEKVNMFTLMVITLKVNI
jgi:hypothetical protein